MRESPQSMWRQRQAAASQDRGGRTMKRRTIKRAVWLLAATLVAGMGLHGAPAAAQDGKWRMAKPLLAPQGEVVSVAIGKKWYVFGGYDGANVQERGIVNMYDAASDTWTEKKNMPVSYTHLTLPTNREV